MKPIITSALGIMSGTSLDGLDLAWCRFQYDGEWSYSIRESVCIPYDENWRSALATAHLSDKDPLCRLDVEFGEFIAQQVTGFLHTAKLPAPDLVCSHGHTVFHDPAQKLTLQIGSGERIAEKTGIKCVSDFRSLDVSLGGQGAPLVPIGDELLFGQYDACLNLGGFSNISFRENGVRIAFDICPVNICLNELSARLGRPYDAEGDLARSGSIDRHLLQRLNELPIYRDPTHPSLSREWSEREFLPLVNDAVAQPTDLLATLTEHAAVRIGQVLKEVMGTGTVLATGGGIHNTFLMERIGRHSDAGIIVPENELADFKEALVFAFLGVLRFHDRINVLSSVTGARRDSSSGVLHSVL